MVVIARRKAAIASQTNKGVFRRHDFVSHYKLAHINTAITESWAIGHVLFAMTKSWRFAQVLFRQDLIIEANTMNPDQTVPREQPDLGPYCSP